MDPREAKLWHAVEQALEGAKQLQLTFPEVKQFLGECLACSPDPDIRRAGERYMQQVRKEDPR